MRVEAGRGRDRGERGLIRAAVLVALALGLACGKGSPPPAEYVTIAVAYRGAPAETIERQVVEPLERAVAATPGLRQLRATAAPDHALLLLVVDDAGAALGAVNGQLERVRAQLPPEALPVVHRGDPDAPAQALFRITGPRPLVELSELARRAAAQLEVVPGVVAVQVRGGVERRLEVRLDAARLVASSITAAEVVTAVRRATLAQATAPHLGDLELVAPNGARVRLHDVAAVSEIVSEPPIAPLELAIHTRPGQAEDAVAAVEARLHELRASWPGVSVTRAEPRPAAARRLVLRGPDRAVLESHAARLAQTLAVTLPPPTVEDHIEIDRDAAAALQVDPAQVAQTLAAIFGGELGELGGLPIVAAKLWDPNALLVRARSGALVPMTALVRRSRVATRVLERIDRQPALVVPIPADRDDPAAVVGELPAGYTATIEGR